MEVLGADTGCLIKYKRRNESSCSDVIVKNTRVQNPNLWLSLLLLQERKAGQAFKAQSKLKTIHFVSGVIFLKITQSVICTLKQAKYNHEGGRQKKSKLLRSL